MPQRCITPNRARASCAWPNLLLSLSTRALLFLVGRRNRRGIGWIASTAERTDAEYFFGPGVCGHPRQAQFFGTQPSVGAQKEGRNGLLRAQFRMPTMKLGLP